MSHVSQLTLRNFDPRVVAEIRRLAKEMRLSLNQAAQLLLKRGAGIEEPRANPRKIGRALDRFFGGMSKKESRQLHKSLEIFDEIDPELWR